MKESHQQHCGEGISVTIRCLILLVSALLFIHCGREGDNTSGFEELSFAVTDSLLGPEYVDSILNFTFCPPLGWDEIGDTTMTEARRRFAAELYQQDSIEVTPRRFFINFQTGDACCLSTVNAPDSNRTVREYHLLYQSLLATKFAGATIVDGTFRVNDIDVYQYIITNDERVIFKLLCLGPDNHLFQIDYALTQPVYREKMKAIESSIGTFRIHG